MNKLISQILDAHGGVDRWLEYAKVEATIVSGALVVIDGSKFKAVNNRDENFTRHKLKGRQQQLEQSIARHLTELDRADRDASLVPEQRVEHLKWS